MDGGSQKEPGATEDAREPPHPKVSVGLGWVVGGGTVEWVSAPKSPGTS